MLFPFWGHALAALGCCCAPFGRARRPLARWHRRSLWASVALFPPGPPSRVGNGIPGVPGAFPGPPLVSGPPPGPPPAFALPRAPLAFTPPMAHPPAPHPPTQPFPLPRTPLPACTLTFECPPGPCLQITNNFFRY